jgi:hypothetical protein
MGILNGLFGKPVDRVGDDVRQNSVAADKYLKKAHSEIIQYGDFTFEYLYTNSEPISQGGAFGSVIYIMIESPVHEFVSTLPVDFLEIQESIDKHQENFQVLPDYLSVEKTRWLYFNMGKNFRAT